MKTVVFTAITGAYDSLKENQVFGKAKPIAFLDKETIEVNEIENSRWYVRKSCSLFKEDNRNAKIHKILAHQYLDCDYSLWIDGNVCCKIPIEKLIEKHLDNADIATFQHGLKTNIYEEAKDCKGLDKGNPFKIDNQIKKYREESFNKNKLFENPVILRRHNRKTEMFNNFWWSEICRHSRRDQISFPYVVDKLGIKVNTFVGFRGKSQNFSWEAHKNE